MNNTKITTLEDVAKEAGVSAMTVSRVVNNHPRISFKTAEKVRKIIKKLGYTTTPSLRKRGRRSRANKGIHTGHVAVATLGLAGSAFKIPLFATTLMGIQNALQAENLSMIIIPMSDLNRLPALVSRKSIDGIIITGFDQKVEVKEIFNDLPVVHIYDIWAGKVENHLVDRVIPDNNAIGKMAANYLISQGCSNAVFLDPSPSHPEFKVRGLAFKQIFEKNGGTVTSFIFGKGKTNNRLVDPDMVEGVLEQQLSKIIKLKDIDSIFLPSDRLTAKAYAFFRKNNIDPAKYKIVSCNNEEPFLEGLYPHPATIEIGAEKIGQIAVELLIQRMADKDLKIRSEIIEPKLIH